MRFAVGGDDGIGADAGLGEPVYYEVDGMAMFGEEVVEDVRVEREDPIGWRTPRKIGWSG